MIKVALKRIGIMFTLALIALADAKAQPVQTDFDGDSYSEFTLVNIQDNKDLDWSYFDANTDSLSALGTFGVAGNHLIPAPWEGLALPQIGIVALDDQKSSILWRIVNSEGATVERVLGKKGFTAISGADFNGNGIADAAAARLVKKKNVEWHISYDMFTRGVGQEAPITVNFGVGGDRIFFASPDGASDWLGAIGKSGKRSVVRLKSLITGEVSTFSRFPRFLSKNPRPRPFPIRRADGIDVLGFSTKKGKNTKVYFYTLDGDGLSQRDLPGTGDIIVGNYNDAPGEEIAIKTGSGFNIYNPFSGQLAEEAVGSGIAVDSININTLSAGSSGGGGGNGGGNNGGGGEGGGPSDIAACRSIKSWPGSHIYKTIGSSHFTDVRRNTIGVIVKPGGVGPFPSCIDVVDRSGNVLARAGLYARGNGWEARYYAGIGCGSSTPYNGANIAGRARQRTGSTSVYMNFGSVCYGPIDASRCIGSSQC